MKPLRSLAVVALIGAAGAVSAKVTDTDRSFLMQESQGARYEVAIAKLAETKATKPAIKAYSHKIISDHAQANAQLATLMKSEGVTVENGMSSDDQTKYDRLKGLSGTDFDQAYVDEVTRINSDDEKSFAEESNATSDPKIKAYVTKFAKMDAAHKKMGEALK